MRHIDLPVHPAAPSKARAYVRRALAAWGEDGVSDVAQLIVSELVTNAVWAMRGRFPGEAPPIRTRVYRARDFVMIEVWDDSPWEPVPELDFPGVENEHGRGLLLVESLAEKWGFRRLPSGGKVVWAALERSSAREERASR